MIDLIPTTENSSPSRKALLSQSISICSSAMQSMQKSQCNSKYIRFRSPSIVSPRVSQTFLNPSESKNKQKTPFGPLEPLRLNFSPVHSKKQQKFSSTQNPRNGKSCESDFLDLEITGTSKLYPIQETGKSKTKIDLEMRKMSISLLQDKRKEVYYDKYRTKLRQVEILRDMNFKAKVMDLQRFRARCKSDSGTYAEKFVETCEISLQTPSNFNNYNGNW